MVQQTRKAALDPQQQNADMVQEISREANQNIIVMNVAYILFAIQVVIIVVAALGNLE